MTFKIPSLHINALLVKSNYERERAWGIVVGAHVDAVLESVTGEKAGHDIPMKVQPPVRPVSLSVLGGQMK